MLFLVGALVVGPCRPGSAEAPERAAAPVADAPLVIANDSGGDLVDYARSVALLRQSGRPVRIGGRCDSACTLLLGLPETQICVLDGASFGFHEAFGRAADMNAWGTRFLLDAYPEWVVDWLDRNGGLTAQIKRMTFEEATPHLRRCPPGHDGAD